jgi:hypothetical protein
MKVFAVSIMALAALAGVASGHGSEYHMMKKWMKTQAMEQCMGAENVKYFKLKEKKAEAKCMGRPAPELDLPMFNAPYKVVNGLLSAKQHAHSHADGGMEGMFKKFMMMQMLQQLSAESPRRFKRQADDLDESSEEDGNLMDNNDMSDVGELELGDKLIEKLRCMKEKYEAKVGNETCVMVEMGLLNDEHEIDLQGMLAHMENMNLNPWLKDRFVQDKTLCYDYAQAIPMNVLESFPCDPKLTRAKKFEKCTCKMTMKSCMMYDTRQKVQDHFGNVDDLTAKTGLDEDELLPLVFKLMNGQSHDH